EAKCAAGEVAQRLRRRIHGRELFGRLLNGYRVERGTITMEIGREPDPPSLDVAELLREIDLATATGDWILRIEARPRRVVVATVAVAPLGFARVQPIEARAAATESLTLPEMPPVRVVRGRDAGDSYNYAPPADHVLVDEAGEERF